jgi:hypothetical protein
LIACSIPSIKTRAGYSSFNSGKRRTSSRRSSRVSISSPFSPSAAYIYSARFDRSRDERSKTSGISVRLREILPDGLHINIDVPHADAVEACRIEGADASVLFLGFLLSST